MSCKKYLNTEYKFFKKLTGCVSNPFLYFISIKNFNTLYIRLVIYVKVCISKIILSLGTWMVSRILFLKTTKDTFLKKKKKDSLHNGSILIPTIKSQKGRL